VVGERGEDAVATELSQLDVRDELDPRRPSELSTQEGFCTGIFHVSKRKENMGGKREKLC